jgi:hypothetical protein
MAPVSPQRDQHDNSSCWNKRKPGGLKVRMYREVGREVFVGLLELGECGDGVVKVVDVRSVDFEERRL